MGQRQVEIISAVGTAVYAHGMHIGRFQSRHLALLLFRDHAIGIKDPAFNGLFACRRVCGGRAGITGGGHHQRHPVVFSFEKKVHRVH